MQTMDKLPEDFDKIMPEGVEDLVKEMLAFNPVPDYYNHPHGPYWNDHQKFRRLAYAMVMIAANAALRHSGPITDKDLGTEIPKPLRQKAMRLMVDMGKVHAVKYGNETAWKYLTQETK